MKGWPNYWSALNTRCDEKDQRLSATVKQNPKIDANVESQVSKSAKPGAPPVFLCQNLRHNYSRRRRRPPATLPAQRAGWPRAVQVTIGAWAGVGAGLGQ